MTVDRPDRSLRDDPLIGQQLGDYTLQRVLATGGIARVYEAEDIRLGRSAAIKVLAPDKLEHDASLKQRFEREARAIAALEHPNIMQIYQYGEHGDLYFLAMKLIRGRDLAQEIKTLRAGGLLMPVERLLRVLAQVAAALDHAHAGGVIHRDVKPSNILLDYEDRATLTDFGLVMNPSIETTMGTAFGTPRYISPEQALSSSRAVPQSDIYSLGIILYEGLTGETPFTGDTPMAIAMNHVTQPPRPPRMLNTGIPPVVETELLRALDKEPARRHPSAGAFIEAIYLSFGSEPGGRLAKAPPATPNARRWWLAGGAGLLLFVALALLTRGG